MKRPLKRGQYDWRFTKLMLLPQICVMEGMHSQLMTMRPARLAQNSWFSQGQQLAKQLQVVAWMRSMNWGVSVRAIVWVLFWLVGVLRRRV